MAENWMPAFAERLRSAREESGYSIEDAAKKVHIHPDRWRDFEDAKEEPSLREGLAICKLLGISPDWAFDIK